MEKGFHAIMFYHDVTRSKCAVKLVISRSLILFQLHAFVNMLEKKLSRLIRRCSLETFDNLYPDKLLFSPVRWKQLMERFQLSREFSKIWLIPDWNSATVKLELFVSCFYQRTIDLDKPDCENEQVTFYPFLWNLFLEHHKQQQNERYVYTYY